MRRLALALIFLGAFASSAFGIILGFSGAGGGGGACATQSYDVQFTANSTELAMGTGETVGQSFVSGVTGTMYSIWLHIYTSDGDETLTIRFDDDADMSSEYLFQTTTLLVNSSNYWHQVVIPEVDRPSLTSSTTYYFFIHTDATYSIVEGGNNYANGTEYWAGSVTWAPGSQPSYDMNFKTEMCD